MSLQDLGFNNVQERTSTRTLAQFRQSTTVNWNIGWSASNSTQGRAAYTISFDCERDQGHSDSADWFALVHLIRSLVNSASVTNQLTHWGLSTCTRAFNKTLYTMRNWIAIDLINVSIEFHGYLRNWPTIYESASLLDVLCKPIIGRFHYNNNIWYGIFSQLLLFNLAMRIHS